MKYCRLVEHAEYCPVCGGEETYPLPLRPDQGPEDLQMACETCHTIFLDHTANEGEIRCK